MLHRDDQLVRLVPRPLGVVETVREELHAPFLEEKLPLEPALSGLHLDEAALPEAVPFEGTVLVEPSGELGGEAAGPYRVMLRPPDMIVAAAAEARNEEGAHWPIAMSQPQFKVTMKAFEEGLRSLLRSINEHDSKKSRERA